MAVDWLLLGAHQAKRGVLGTLDQAAECVLEGWSRGQRIITAAALRLAAQRCAFMEIGDAGLGQAPGQPFLAELREAARVGHGAHVDQQRNAARLQEIDEALDGMIGMADGLDGLHGNLDIFFLGVRRQERPA